MQSHLVTTHTGKKKAREGQIRERRQGLIGARPQALARNFRLIPRVLHFEFETANFIGLKTNSNLHVSRSLVAQIDIEITEIWR